MSQFAFPETWQAGVGGYLPKPLIWPFLGESVRGEDGQLSPAGYRIFAPEVALFHRSQARIRIVTAPARTAKSYSTAYDVIPDLFPRFEPGKKGAIVPCAPQKGRNTKLAWIIGPDFQTNKEFDYLWQELVIRKGHLPFPFQLGRHLFSPKQGSMEIELIWGKDRHGEAIRTVVQGKSATSPETLQGEEVDLWVQSEAAEHPGKIYARYGATRAGRIVIPTTPKIAGAWVKDLIDIGDAVRHLPACWAIGEDGKTPGCVPGCPVVEVGIESFQFTPHANPHYDWSRYWQEHGFAESRVAGRILTSPRGHDCFGGSDCQAMRDPWFAEQFGGRWTFEADRVLPFKWQPLFADDWCHVQDAVPAWFYEARYFCGVDYGFTDGTCVQWWALGGDGQLLIYREIYEKGLDVGQLAKRVLEQNRLYGERIEYYVGDPQKPEVAKVFREHGMTVIERNKGATRDRAAGHARLVHLLTPKEGKPRLSVLSEKAGRGYGCPKTIQEWRVLKRREGANRNEFSAAALSGADHAYDVARYISSSLPNVIDTDTIVEREMRQLRRNAERFRVSQRHTGPLTGAAPRRLHVA